MTLRVDPIITKNTSIKDVRILPTNTIMHMQPILHDKKDYERMSENITSKPKGNRPRYYNVGNKNIY